MMGGDKACRGQCALDPGLLSGSAAASAYLAVFLCRSRKFLNVHCDIKLQGLGEVGGGRPILQEGDTEA